MASVKISATTTTTKERETLRDISPYFSSNIQPKCGETNIEEKKNTKNQKRSIITGMQCAYMSF